MTNHRGGLSVAQVPLSWLADAELLRWPGQIFNDPAERGHDTGVVSVAEMERE
jgi:hypothetical protein